MRSLILLASLAGLLSAAPPRVVWDSPSIDARGSMPLGNGDIGLNAWVDPAGDLLVYIGKSDAWEDHGRLAKLGLLRLKLQSPLKPPFVQVLDPARGEMTVSASTPDGAAVTVALWADARHPVVHLAIDGTRPPASTLSFELWRRERKALPSIEKSDVNLDRRRKDQQSVPTVVEPDLVLKGIPDGIGWLHHNKKSVGPAETMAHQDLSGAPWQDPLLHRSFGCLIRSAGADRSDDVTLSQPAGRSHRYDIHVLTKHPASPALWLQSIRASAARIGKLDFAARREAHLGWWKEFWERSHIEITPSAAAADRLAPADVTRGYALQRFITACAGRGAYPIKFNGSLFTVPWPGKPGDADYRQWGPGYFWQNTRLPYAPLCSSGDFDLLSSLHGMYAKGLLEIGKYRTRRYFGFEDAAYFTEVSYIWGAVFADTYGRETTAAQRKDKLQASGWHKWEWVAGLELSFMLLDQYEHGGDAEFLRGSVLPVAMPVLRFFDRFYRPGPDGKLHMFPSQALETWWSTTDPMPEVAGLHAVTGRLLALPDGLLEPADRLWLEAFRARIPELPTRELKGKRLLAPARVFRDKKNIENPELYAVYPFRLVSFEKDNAALGIEAFRQRTDRGAFGWRQEEIFSAYLGLTAETRAGVVARARRKDSACRFPAFWGPNYDWTPDQCHGGVLMKAVQAMLLQSEGEKIHLLPAWPADWNVDFKLHAPRRTVVEGEVRDGKLVRLTVNPPVRSADVIVAKPYAAP